ncbi:MAG: hypothetical protein IKA59_02525 [Clostridia bacterium]|nr:hypothetical protein [Clostridia bacterium]
MANTKSDFFGLPYWLSLILTIIPVTSWLLGAITRLMEGKIVAGLIRLFGGGLVIWIIDIVFMIKDKKIWRLLNV